MEGIINIEEMRREKREVEVEILKKLNDIREKYGINIAGVRMMTHQRTGRILGIEIKVKI